MGSGLSAEAKGIVMDQWNGLSNRDGMFIWNWAPAGSLGCFLLTSSISYQTLNRHRPGLLDLMKLSQANKYDLKHNCNGGNDPFLPGIVLRPSCPLLCSRTASIPYVDFTFLLLSTTAEVLIVTVFVSDPTRHTPFPIFFITELVFVWNRLWTPIFGSRRCGAYIFCVG